MCEITHLALRAPLWTGGETKATQLPAWGAGLTDRPAALARGRPSGLPAWALPCSAPVIPVPLGSRGARSWSLAQERQKQVPEAGEVGGRSPARSWVPGAPCQSPRDSKPRSLQSALDCQTGEEAPVHSGYFRDLHNFCRSPRHLLRSPSFTPESAV